MERTTVQPVPPTQVEAEAQRQKTALVYRNAGIAQSVNVVNASALAFTASTLHQSNPFDLAWWAAVLAISAGRYLLARRFRAAAPDAVAAPAWRRRYLIGTAMNAVAWGSGSVLFMWNAPDGARMFAGLVLCGMVAGAVPLLSPVPVAYRIFAILVTTPMSAVVLFQATSMLHWAFGAMSLVFLASVLASARYLHQTLDVAIRLGLEERRLVEGLERASAAAEAALAVRTRLEEEMRRERDFAEGLIDTAQAIVLVLDTEGRIVRYNRYLEEISGRRLEEFKGTSWFETFLPGRVRDPTWRLFQAAIGELRTRAKIGPILASDGRELLIEWYDKTLKDAAGQVVGLLAIGQDVTQREKLAGAQRLLSAAVEQSNSAIVVTDADARIIFVNSAFTRTTGYQPDEVLGQNPRILKSGMMPQEVYQDLWNTLVSGRSWRGELCNKTSRGELYWEAASISPIVDEFGRTTNYLAVMDDITQRRRVEDALQEQRSFLAAVLENEPEGVTVIGADGRLLQVNSAGLSMLEVKDVEEANAVGLANFVVPEHRAAFVALTRRVQGGETGVLEFRLEGRRGTRRWLEIHSAPLRDAAGTITHQLGVTRDVTQRRLAEERLAMALRGSDLATADWHVPGDALDFGEGWTKLLGYTLDELPPQAATLAELVMPADALEARRALIRHLKGETPFVEVEVRMRHKSGRWIWVSGRGMAVERAAGGRALRVAGTAMDVTARKEAEAEVARLSEWNQLLLDSVGEGIYGSDRDGNCTFINPAALAALGFEREELTGKNIHQMFHHLHLDGTPYPQAECPLDRTGHDGVRREVEDAFVRKNGEVFPVHLSATPMHEGGQLVGVAVVFQDISRRKALEAELTRLATTDPLTGVANRRRFIEELGQELERLKRFGRPAAFLMVDLDQFKRINDTHGHPTGDAVLQHLAELARHRLRKVDLFGRLGGEEFGILLPATDAAGARQCAESFRRNVAEAPFQRGQVTIPVTVSIGVAVLDAADAAPEGVLARADRALYRAKEGGRNRVEME